MVHSIAGSMPGIPPLWHRPQFPSRRGPAHDDGRSDVLWTGWTRRMMEVIWLPDQLTARLIDRRSWRGDALSGATGGAVAPSNLPARTVFTPSASLRCTHLQPFGNGVGRLGYAVGECLRLLPVLDLWRASNSRSTHLRLTLWCLLLLLCLLFLRTGVFSSLP